mmetsp:Transcript_11717/g.33837  ORF Transcript_11717/g.33837 Transcript_11717/m.33837 type:complete len:304 (+) Transcript_11717:200-1111(+)
MVRPRGVHDALRQRGVSFTSDATCRVQPHGLHGALRKGGVPRQRGVFFTPDATYRRCCGEHHGEVHQTARAHVPDHANHGPRIQGGGCNFGRALEQARRGSASSGARTRVHGAPLRSSLRPLSNRLGHAILTAPRPIAQRSVSTPVCNDTDGNAGQSSRRGHRRPTGACRVDPSASRSPHLRCARWRVAPHAAGRAEDAWILHARKRPRRPRETTHPGHSPILVLAVLLRRYPTQLRVLGSRCKAAGSGTSPIGEIRCEFHGGEDRRRYEGPAATSLFWRRLVYPCTYRTKPAMALHQDNRDW